jgi:hypothetical protein
VLDAAKIDGNGEGAKDVLIEGYKAATHPTKVGDRIKGELGTSPTKLLGESQKTPKSS